MARRRSRVIWRPRRRGWVRGVLLLEVDLRRPTIARQLDVRSGPGLADVLIGAVPLREAIQTVGLDGSSGEGAPSRSLDVLVAGAALPPNPGELVEPIGDRLTRWRICWRRRSPSTSWS